MTEREAWLWLADLWASPDMDACVVIGGDQCTGLCRCIEVLRWAGRIDFRVYCGMRNRVDQLPNIGDSYLKWPTDLAGARQRAAFCREQAEQYEGVTT